jgi:hypothetical protein
MEMERGNAARELVPERTGKTHAEPVRKKKPGPKPETVNLSFYRHKQERGTEPLFRRTKRERPETTEDERYIERIERKFEREEAQEQDEEKYVERMAETFKIETAGMKRKRALREIVAQKEPEIEFSI